MAEGHSVGLHSYTHEYSFLYPKRYANMNNIISEVDQNIAAIKKSLGDEYTPTTLRYPGVVLLMNDIKKKSVDALPSIIEYYPSMGYKFGILD